MLPNPAKTKLCFTELPAAATMHAMRCYSDPQQRATVTGMHAGTGRGRVAAAFLCSIRAMLLFSVCSRMGGRHMHAALHLYIIVEARV